SPNKTSPRNHAIDTITIHCMAGNLTIETCGNVFAPTSRQASSNYGIGSDGRIGMYVEEKDRSWCSSNGVNDHRAVTIEVANDGGANTGWHVSDKAMAALINLVTDICKRNGIKKLVWSDKKDDRVNHRNGCNMTVHRDYANKSCPGDYLYGKHAYIAAEVNKRLGATTTETPAVTPTTGSFLVKVMITDLNIRAGAGTNTAKKGVIKPGTYTIVEVKSGKGSTAGWGKLKSGAGWISLDYAKRV
ncbi:MAG: N-acetylmuramoyl-L-alanine amidase, partial [Clostridia bacterium]|nr:N-acetylmuramoyl-L-alanine amidase [Clostridia bacterium]